MNTEKRKKKSKLLSYVLRHRPDVIGVSLDEAGWVEVEELLDCLTLDGRPMSAAQLEEVVTTNDKQRFEFDDDQTHIRARQGHSVPVDLGYEALAPPEFLYHGTAAQFVDSILATGLNKGKRHHVHMSVHRELMLAVGQRRGRAVLIRIAAGRMHADGITFCKTGNDVWLTDHVPAEYVSVDNETDD